MKTVFSHIIQKKYSQENENIATEALAYILNYSDKARIAFVKILQTISPDLPELLFQTQGSEGNIRPDMWGYSGADVRVYVENKFWAGLTDNQPVNYIKSLKEKPYNSVLLFIVPTARVHSLWRELCSRIKETEMKLGAATNGGKIQYTAKVDDNVSIAITTWEDTLQTIEQECTGDERVTLDISQLRSLCKEANQNEYLPITSEFNSNQTIPKIILQLNNIMQQVIDQSIEKGILNTKGLNSSSSEKRLGRYASLLNKDGVGIWIGTDFELWQRNGGSPLWVTFSKSEWGRAKEVHPILKEWAIKNDYSYEYENDLASINIKIPANEGQEVVIKSIIDQLDKIGQILKELNKS